MIINEPEEYIQYRFQRALESLEDAEILAEKNRWNAVINRLYYASFYAVICLLIKEGVETRTHEGARQQFGLLFIKTQKIGKNFGKLYSTLADYRQKGDYGDLFDFDEMTVKPLIDEVKKFLEILQEQLNS